MLTKFYIIIFCFHFSALMAQDVAISGKVMDSGNNPLSFVNVLLYAGESESPLKGTTTEEDGSFNFKEMEAGTYKIAFSYIGFENFEQTVEVSSHKFIGNVILKESTEKLNEAVVSAKLPTIQKTAGKLVFIVENTSFSVGSTMDLLKKTPGVVVIGENIQVKFSTPIVYINEKRVYLSSSEVAALLENTDASRSEEHTSELPSRD